MKRVLVVGYGNRSRTDDGVGWFVVEQLQESGRVDAEFLFLHQLEVELAETISHYDLVVFVDAATAQDPQLVTRKEVSPTLQGHAVTHYFTPGDLLALCQSLYYRQPQGTLFSIRGQDFNFGSTLSPVTERAALDVVRQITHLIQSLQAQRNIQVEGHHA